MAGAFLIDVGERFTVHLDMRRSVPVGTVLVSAPLIATDLADNAIATTTVLTRTTAVIQELDLAITVLGVGAGHRYKIAATAHDATGGIYRESLIMWVRPE